MGNTSLEGIPYHYHNIAKGIDYTPIYLEHFFRNLLFDEQWDLRNRYLHIHPTEEWSVQPNLTEPTTNRQVPDKYPTSSRQVADKLHTNNPNIIRLIQVVGEDEVSVKELVGLVGLKDRENFLQNYLNPAIEEGYICLLYPNSPRHPRQKYLLTVKGMELYNELTK